MKKLSPNETELVGQWIDHGSCVVGDEVCERIERIEWLLANHLRKVGHSKKYGAWETLYQDTDDGRFWVKTYPQSEMHGGGPPLLKYVTDDTAKTNFESE